MGAPSVSVTFIERAQTLIQRGDRGVMAMILVDAQQQSLVLRSITEIPDTLTDDNQTQLKLAMLGYQTAPKKIYLEVITSKDAYSDALGRLSKYKWSWLTCPSAETDGEVDTIATWIKEQREKHHAKYKAVLPYAADSEAIVNVANGCTYNGTYLSAEKMCARVAGILCGTPLTMSCTYAPLPEMSDCDRLEDDDLDEAVDTGKLVFFWDGEKVKICRGVTSFVTTTEDKGDSFKKIKLVEAMDMISDDIRTTAQDKYIGKYANTYDNKLLLITAIDAYMNTLSEESVIASGTVEIDTEANVKYFKQHGNKLVVDDETIAVEDATDLQLKKGQTGSYVFLVATITLVDAIEDVGMKIYIG